MSDAPKTAYIVSHTHWDREWYKPYHQFRVDLTRIVQRVLEALENDEDYRHFLLDGQSIVLEDYLEVFPEDEVRLAKLVEAKALSVGPWYILPDEFLVSAEATVRNLIIGHKVAGRLGRVQKVGYMPDSFGHIAQMPQILRLAGIDSFVYSRGNGDEIERTGHEFFWQAPDGSQVLAVNQCKGYDNAAGLGLASYWEAHTQREIDLELAVERVRDLFTEMRKLSQGDIYLLNNGGDHIGPQREFGAILDALHNAFPGTSFVHTGMQEYIDAVMAAGFVKNQHSGEMVQGRFHFILSGVWSARMYLKQLNDLAQTTLSLYAEPLAAYGRFCLNRLYPTGALESAWKLLLQNHPHDSICGCSTDEVHREMVPRFEGVMQTGEQLMRHQMTNIVPTFARSQDNDVETVICVVNPLPRRRSVVVERLVVLQNRGPDVEGLVLYDEAGRAVPYEIVDKRYVKRFWGVDYRTDLFCEKQKEMLDTYLNEFGDGYLVDDPESEDHDCFLTIQFLAEDLPGVGHALYYLREGALGEDGLAPTGVVPKDEVNSGERVIVVAETIENEFFSVRLHRNGTFDVHDKHTGQSYTGLNQLEDTEDIGDEYDYSPCSHSETITSVDAKGTVRALEDSGLRGRLQAEFSMELPESMSGSRTARSATRVACSVRVQITLEQCSPLIDVELLFDNCAKDHRLRAEFPTGIKTDTVVSDGHFYFNHRSIEQPEGLNWKQRPSGTYPQQDFSLVQDGERGLAVLNKGLPEIEATSDLAGHAKLSLTLLRSVGWLSRDDFETRSCSNAGPTLFTPDAQCLGAQKVRYALLPFSGDYLDAGIKGISQRYKTQVLSIQGVADSSIAGGLSLLEHSSNYTSVSAIKRHEERDTLVIRLYNLRREHTEDTLTFDLEIAAAWRTDLLEERIEELTPTTKRGLQVKLEPFEILTLEVVFAR
ncbi:alpha-mannosidase [Gemmatimonadota bacterium]